MKKNHKKREYYSTRFDTRKKLECLLSGFSLILEYPEYLILRFPSYDCLTVLQSSNLTSVIKQFIISRIFLLVQSYSIIT